MNALETLASHGPMTADKLASLLSVHIEELYAELVALEGAGKVRVLCHKDNSREWEAMDLSAKKFDAWLAGATEAQVERWKKLQAAAPVRDDELPPALRGGALEVF